MSELPQNKKLVRVIYEYENGERYEVTGEYAENLQENIASVSSIAMTRSYCAFKEVEWKKLPWKLNNKWQT